MSVYENGEVQLREALRPQITRQIGAPVCRSNSRIQETGMSGWSVEYFWPWPSEISHALSESVEALGRSRRNGW